ncbi:MAG TPA: PfkB family carbohydrate kinase [Terriglobia bacterium]|nr:PfkB family carbohydrate kinase [Terriglobia bacterium]
MSLLVVGSVAFDAVRTPHGSVEKMLGGSATYFAVAASYFAPVRVVGVVGDDFEEQHLRVLRDRGVCTEGIERVPGKTFFWAGEYAPNMNERTTLDTQLNVFATFQPKLPGHYRQSPFLFLANIHPRLQRQVQEQMRSPQLVGGDTMNLWIETERPALERMLQGLDILVINDAEARQLSGEWNLAKAGRRIRALGPRTVVIKRGDNGASVYEEDHVFMAPALPLENVVDPTGAGDSFAGGFMGYLAASANGVPTTPRARMRRAIIYGSVMGSFAVERFGLERLQHLTREEIDDRYSQFRQLTHFD